MSDAAARKRIVIADDDPGVVALLSALCEDAGYRTVVASDGAAAVEATRRLLPDLVLLDGRMPEMSGFDGTRALKENDATKHIPVIILTGLKSREDRLRGISAGADDFLTKPIDHEELMIRIRNLLKIKEFHDFLHDHNAILESRVERRTRELHEALEKLQASTERLKESHIETIQRLVVAAEFKDEETGVHIRRLGALAHELASSMGMPATFTETILAASPLHDVGKVSIPDSVLRKNGPLTPAEWDVLKTHTLCGARILHGSESDYLQMAERIALTHHERWDGSGYPQGLTGAEIPLEGRIVNICDQYDALRSRRPYKPLLDHDTVLGIISQGDGRTEPGHFDPEVHQAFLRFVDRVRAVYDEARDPEAGGGRDSASVPRSARPPEPA